MRNIILFAEHFLFAMVWVFLLIIVGFALLSWVRNTGGSNIFGQFADWVDSHAQPQA